MIVFHILKNHYVWKNTLTVILKVFIFIAIYTAVIVPIKASNNDSVISKLVQSAEQEFNLGNYKEASVFYKRAISKKKQLQSNELTSEYIGLSLTYLERGQTDTAMLLIDTARYYKNLRNADSISTSLENNSARIYLDQGDFDNALEHFLLALKNAQKEMDTINQVYINLNMGTLYQRMKKYDLALEHYLESYELSKLSNNLHGQATAYSIGIIYQNRGEYEKALEYNRKAIPICKELNNYQDLSRIYSNMSNVFMLMKEYDKAEDMLRKSIKLSSQRDLKRQLAIAYANMGKTKELMGLADSAVFYLEKSILVVEKLGTPNLLSAVYRLTSDAYEEGSDFENAFIFYKKYIELKDSVFSENVEKQIAELQTKYETEKKEKENYLLKQDIEFEKRKSYYLLLLAVILSLMGAISLALFYFIRKNIHTKRELAESEAARLELELESQKRELTLGALSLSRNIEFINSLIGELKDLSDCVSENGLSTLNNIVKKLARQQSGNSWKEFEKRFSEIHSEFYSRLINEFPNLSQSEVKLSAFLKLGMNTKEICSITFQSIRAIEAARLRLRKKLGLTNGDNLSMFLQKL